VIATRLANSRAEIAHWREYDYVIVNDDLNTAFEAVQSIVRAERLRRDRRHGMFDFVTGLIEETPVL
jgi:guanylate kinase